MGHSDSSRQPSDRRLWTRSPLLLGRRRQRYAACQDKCGDIPVIALLDADAEVGMRWSWTIDPNDQAKESLDSGIMRETARRLPTRGVRAFSRGLCREAIREGSTKSACPTFTEQ